MILVHITMFLLHNHPPLTSPSLPLLAHSLSPSLIPLSLPPSLLSSSDASLELDFDALDDDLSDSGEHKTSSLSVTPSPPLSRDSLGLTDSGASYSNLDNSASSSLRVVRESNNNRSSPSSSPNTNHVHDKTNGTPRKENGVSSLKIVEDKNTAPLSPTGSMSISLGSLDLDFDFPMTSFGLGTITEGRSLMNIPMTTSSETPANSSASTSNGSDNQTTGQATSDGTGVLQRSISQQPSHYNNGGVVAEKGRKLSLQSPKASKPPPPKTAPKTAPKPRRGSYSVSNCGTPPLPPTTSITTATITITQKPSYQTSPLSISKIGRQTSETTASQPQRLSPQQVRNEMMRSTPSLFPSPPSSRRYTDSLPRPSSRSKAMIPLLPFQAQQELREAAKQVRQDNKKSANGIIPQMKQGSPILLRRGPTKQPSPPLPYRGGSSNNAKHSPKHVPSYHQPRASPTSSRLYSHLSPGMKASSSMSHLSPSASRLQDERTNNISRNSSIDSGIQYTGEGENGTGGAPTGERASNTSTASSGAGSVATSDSVASTSTTSSGLGGGGGGSGGESKTRETDKEEKKKKVSSEGLGDFSDILSVIANMGGGDSFFS